MTKRIGMSEAARQVTCAEPRVNHAWIAGFVAINGHWANVTAKLIWINDSIGKLWMLFQTAGVYLGKVGSEMNSRLNDREIPNTCMLTVG